MARVSTELKRLFVRNLADSVEDGEVSSLSLALKTLRKSQFQVISSGEIILSRTADGFSGTFAMPNAAASSGLTPAGIAELASELTDLYDRALVWLTKVAKYGLDADTIDEDGWPAPLPNVVDANPSIADSDIADRMLVYLVPTYEMRSDFTSLGVAGGAWT